MEILSFPVGLLAGVIPVYVSLTPTESPAKLYLDGREVCTLSSEVRSCQVDLGSEPALHRLELVALTRDGRTVRVRRWVNRPGQAAELFLHVERRSGAMKVDVGWGHPERLEPRELRLRLGTEERLLKPGEPFMVQLPLPEPPVMAVEAIFPDGQRAQRFVLLQSGFADEVETVLSPTVVEVAAGTETPGELLGCQVVAVEEGDAVIGVVAHPATVRALADEVIGGSFAGSRRSQHLASRIPFLRQVVAVAPTEELPHRESRAKPSSGKGQRAAGLVTLPALLPFTKRDEPRRFADATALAAFRVAAWPGRRAVVLILDRECGNDRSAFKAGAVLRYLEQLHVPLFVWSIGRVQCPQWPSPYDVASVSRFDEALGQLESVLSRQRVVWLQGELPFPIPLSAWPPNIHPPKVVTTEKAVP